VGDGDLQLRGGERDGQGGVHVARHADEVRAVLLEDLLDLHQRPAGLRAVRARADPEPHVRRPEPEVVHHVRRHPIVVVLAGVHDRLPHALVCTERVDDGRHLDEVGACAHDVKDVGRHAFVHRSAHRYRCGLGEMGPTVLLTAISTLRNPD
jgi:hypothetical protein